MKRAGPVQALESWGCVDVEVRFRDQRGGDWCADYTFTVRHGLFEECMNALGFVADKSLYPRWVRRTTWKEG